MLAGCSSSQKLLRLRDLQENLINIPEMEARIDTAATMLEDTITVNIDGREMVVMKAVRDEETGEMVAHQELKAAFVSARFRNVAERRGKIDLEFQLRVPEAMMDSRWQLRFYPSMFVNDETHSLEPVFITGREYRKIQLRGYQQYQRFLNSIITDSVDFINVHQLNIFLKRNIPQIYAYRDSENIVSDEEFFSHYGVTERMAVEHYTNKMKIRRNDRKIERKEEMFNKLVRLPIITSGLRLDSLYQEGGEFVYTYVQPVDVTRSMRRVEVVMNGDIYEETERIYGIPYSSPIVFYVSSLSAIADNSLKYRKIVTERKVTSRMTGNVEFDAGRAELKPGLGGNRSELSRIRYALRSYLEDPDLVLDSVRVTSYASPDGSVAANKRLSLQRASALSAHLKNMMSQLRDSVKAEAGSYDLNGDFIGQYDRVNDIRVRARNGGENWDMFTELVESDENLDQRHKDFYLQCLQFSNLDSREEAVKSSKVFYKYCRDNIYPKLRTVRLDFYQHRKGMVKDTVHTSVVDSVYMQGVQAIHDRDYEKAISVLGPYADFNTAVAYCSLDRNKSAMAILENLEKTAGVNYLLAILYSREGDTRKAVQHYLDACRQERNYRIRGNLDPEIAELINLYNLNK